MRTEKKAAVPTATRTHNYRIESYQKDYRLSNLKLQLGEILFFWLSQNQQGELKQAFEATLSKYIDFRYEGPML